MKSPSKSGLIALVIALIIGLLALFISCEGTYPDIIGPGAGKDSGTSGGAASGGEASSGEASGGEAEDDDHPLAGASSGAQGIMLKDAYGSIVDIDTPLTVPTMNSDGTLHKVGKRVDPTLSDVPAGFNYLKWEITGAASLVYVTPGAAMPHYMSPFVIALGPGTGSGTATVTVRNCNNKGFVGALKATFAVELEERSDPVAIKFSTYDGGLVSDIPSTTLKKAATGTAFLIVQIAGDLDDLYCQWTLDGTDIAEEDGGTKSFYTFDSTAKDPGTYRIGLKVTKAGAEGEEDVDYETSSPVTITVIN
jgi:hypothetical protein